MHFYPGFITRPLTQTLMMDTNEAHISTTLFGLNDECNQEFTGVIESVKNVIWHKRTGKLMMGTNEAHISAPLLGLNDERSSRIRRSN